jgi:hypothetical protein
LRAIDCQLLELCASLRCGKKARGYRAGTSPTRRAALGFGNFRRGLRSGGPVECSDGRVLRIGCIRFGFVSFRWTPANRVSPRGHPKSALKTQKVFINGGTGTIASINFSIQRSIFGRGRVI